MTTVKLPIYVTYSIWKGENSKTGTKFEPIFVYHLKLNLKSDSKCSIKHIFILLNGFEISSLVENFQCLLHQPINSLLEIDSSVGSGVRFEA